MVGAYYKGDVSEVLMGHETGLHIAHGEPCTWTASYAAGTDYTLITFTGTGGSDGFFKSGNAVLLLPTGMLTGCRLSFHGSSGSGFSPHYYTGVDSRVYTIIDHTLNGAASATTLKVTPAFHRDASTALTSATGDEMVVHSTGLPTAHPTYGSWTASAIGNASAAAESALIDQFIGLASFMTLPDTKVELHEHHVVGLGRQPTVLQPGRLHHTGGALEMPLNSPRWLYYCLGREVVDAHTMISGYSAAGTLVTNTTIQPGQVYVDVTSLTFGGQVVGAGDYILIKDLTRVPTVYHKHADEGTTDFWPGASSASSLTSDAHHFEATESHEIRRVVTVRNLSGGTKRLYVDDPFHFAHSQALGDTIYAFAFNTASTEGSPEINSDGTITRPVPKLLFSGDTIPSFCIEHSIRNRDVGSHGSNQENGPAPGSSTDSKQLTRIFKGCKISEWEISSTVDAELKFRAIFDALSCYTDTGRMESTPGDRYTAHRMFNNVGNTTKGRKEAGIAVGSETPFMFYNGTIELFGQSLANIAAFELRGKTGVELFHVIQGNPAAETIDASGRSTKQVPYGGTRNAAIIREGREQFEMEIDVLISDPLLWNELRAHRSVKGTVGNTGSIINLHWTKPTTGTTGSIPSLRILIDDYVITEAPIPVPDDKGLLKSKIKLTAKNVKVVSTDSLFHC